MFWKSGKPIYNSEVPDTAGRKMRRKRRRRRTQGIAKRYAFHANAQISNSLVDCVTYGPMGKGFYHQQKV